MKKLKLTPTVKYLLILPIIFLITSLSAITLHAQNTWYVSPAGSDTTDGSSGTPWRTIQFAVNSSAVGDTIKVMDDDDESTDDYTENVFLFGSDDNLVIMRADTVGPNPQVKALNASAHVFQVFGSDVTIDGLDIYGAGGSNRAGILSFSTGLIVQNCRIGWSASKTNVRGIWASGFTSSFIRNNEITASSDAIYMQTGTTGNSFFNNIINGTSNAFNFESGAGNNRIYLNDITGSISSSSTAGNFWNSENIKIYTHDGGTQFGQFLGNFYSSHSNTDTDANGLADASFSLPGNEPEDAFPLAKSQANFETITGSLVFVEQVDTATTSGGGEIPILKINIVVSGAEITLQSLTMDTDGSSFASDISDAYMYRTDENIFSTNTSYGNEIGQPDGEMVFSEEVALGAGFNYYWLAYDVSSSATPGNVLDAELTEVIINEGAQTLEAPDPVGNVPIDPGSDITGLSLSLDGVNDYLDIPYGINSNQFTDSLTIEFWIKGSSTSTVDVVLEKGVFDNEYFIKTSNQFFSSGGNHIVFGVKNNRGLVTTQEVMDGKWHHFAATLNTVTDILRLYVDGKLDRENTDFTGNITLNGGGVTVGSRSGTDALDANIDELRFWSTVRTEEQIQKNMYQKLAGNETGLAAYYSFDEFSTSTITDATGTANHGTLENGARLDTEPHPRGTFVRGGEGWRIMSSPFENVAYSTLLDSLATQGFTGADAPSGTSNVYTWDESTQQFASISNATDIPSPGKAFITFVYDDNDFDAIPDGFPKNIRVEETQNNGTITPTLSFTDTETISADGWNLVGNPYGSSIDWDASNGLSSANLDASMYIWDDSQNSGTGAYLTWNGITGTLDNGLIAPWQGFWVKANATSPSLTLNDSTRSGGGIFRKQAPVPEIKFTLTDSTLSSNAIVLFHEQARIHKDALDAYKLQPLSSDYLSLYTELEDGSGLDINALPIQLEEALTVPLDFDGSNLLGSLDLSWEPKSFQDGMSVTLVDTETGTEINLSEASSYSFEVESKAKAKSVKTQNLASLRDIFPQHQVLSPKVVKAKSAESTSRFVLKINTNTLVGVEPNSDLPKVVELDQNYPNPFNPSTTIAFGVPKNGKVTLEVFDVLGRKVATLLNAESKTAGRHTVTFNANNLASGMYIYRLKAGNSVITKKLTLIK